jgi:hypothetical protein
MPACVHVNTRIRTHTHSLSLTHTHAHTYTHTNTHTHTHIHTCTHIHARARAQVGNTKFIGSFGAAKKQAGILPLVVTEWSSRCMTGFNVVWGARRGESACYTNEMFFAWCCLGRNTKKKTFGPHARLSSVPPLYRSLGDPRTRTYRIANTLLIPYCYSTFIDTV